MAGVRRGTATSSSTRTGTTSEEAIRNRWRRLLDAVEAVRVAVARGDSDETVPDALARTLDALYDLGESLKKGGGYSNKALEDLASGDGGGETTLGLLSARGAKTHELIDFGDLHTFGSHKYGEGPYGGGWAWQEFRNSDAWLHKRSAWYASRVRGHRVLDPLEVALKWLADRFQLTLD